jgi:thiol-disulfide isomerase/thioredoxin
MSPTLNLGPLALPLAPLLFGAAILAGLAVGQRLGRRGDVDALAVLLQMLLIGAVGARLGFVWQWRGPYLRDPLSILDLRDGGWAPVAGFAAAYLYALARMNRQRALRRPLIGATLTALVLGAAVQALLPATIAPGAPLSALSALSLTALDGRSVTLTGLQGRPAVVNLWATWCPPCRRELPLLLQAQGAHADIHFVFVDQGETRDAVARFLSAQNLPLRNVLLDPALAAAGTFDQRALPTTLFFDAGGRLVATRVGALSAATLAESLASLQAAPAVLLPRLSQP